MAAGYEEPEEDNAQNNVKSKNDNVLEVMVMAFVIMVFLLMFVKTVFL